MTVFVKPYFTVFGLDSAIQPFHTQIINITNKALNEKIIISSDVKTDGNNIKNGLLN